MNWIFISVPKCDIQKGYIVDNEGNCVCPTGTALSSNDECIRCLPERGQRIDEHGHCVCALEKGMIIDERGNCICPTEYGYRIDINGNCKPGEYHYLYRNFKSRYLFKYDKTLITRANWHQKGNLGD